MANNVGGCFAGAAVPQAKASNMLPLLSCSGLDYVPSPEGAKRKLPSCEPLRNVEGNEICNSAGILDADTLTKITGPVPSRKILVNFKSLPQAHPPTPKKNTGRMPFVL